MLRFMNILGEVHCLQYHIRYRNNVHVNTLKIYPVLLHQLQFPVCMSGLHNYG